MSLENLGIVPKLINTVIVALVLPYALWKRRRPKVHIPTMLSAFTVDLVNVVLVEYYARISHGKGAVEQGIGAFTGNGSFLSRFHIIVSVLSILGYLVAIATGTRLYRKGRSRKVHKVNALLFLGTRYASYVTSFWM